MRRGAIVVREVTAMEPAFHIGTASTLYRRAPSWQLPVGFVPVEVPERVNLPWESGSLARAGLLLPLHPFSLRYMIPPGIAGGVEHIWRSCPISGLDLPCSVADEMWFLRRSAICSLTSPSQLGVTAPPGALSTVAWFVLLHSLADGDDTFRLLADLAFRLEIVGLGHDVTVDLARAVGSRWRVGAGLVAAAGSGRPWLNPRCLRWIIRELAAALVAAEDGVDPLPEVGFDERIATGTWFPHVFGNGAQPDVLDVVMACWLLHEEFHGASVDLNGVNSVTAMMTALGFANGSWAACFGRIASWSSIWAIEDDDRLRPAGGWQGTPPSLLRAAYREVTGVEVRDWLAGCLLVLIPSWNNATALFARIDIRPIQDRLPPALPGGVAGLIHEQLGISIPALGAATIDAMGGADKYGGLGSTPQEERSPLYDRPVLTFSDGSAMVVSAAAFAGRAVAVPRETIEAYGEAWNRRKVAVRSAACSRPQLPVSSIDFVTVITFLSGPTSMRSLTWVLNEGTWRYRASERP